MARAAKGMEREVSGWPGVEARPHRFGGTEFRVGGHEIGHVHGDRQADLPFPRRVREDLVASGRASLHHLLPETGWVTYYIEGSTTTGSREGGCRRWRRARLAVGIRPGKRSSPGSGRRGGAPTDRRSVPNARPRSAHPTASDRRLLERNPVIRRSPYPTDLTDDEWAVLAPLAPWSSHRGRPRKWPVRRVLDAVFYVLRSGCAWRMLPRDFPPWQTVFYHFRRWRLTGLWHRLHGALRAATRQRQARHPEASAGIVDSQSVKTTEESGGIGGYDAAKGVKGRKRHLLVDPSGLVLSAFVSPASTQDRDGARRLLAGLGPLMPRLELIWADGAYSGRKLARWCEERGGWRLEVVRKRDGAEGFEVLPRRWVVERTFAWLGRQRRLSKDYERKVQTSETMIEIAMSRLMLARLARAP